MQVDPVVNLQINSFGAVSGAVISGQSEVGVIQNPVCSFPLATMIGI
ncbi:MAG: hypothetical protein ACI9NQ_001217 [Paracoccaceae bacterium]|jgi:hypothetical protein